MIHGVIPIGERHAPHNWEYADAAERTAASGFVSADLNKLALQLDDGTYWRLSAISPVTWGAVGGSSSGGGGTATIIQETGTLDQGYSLVVSHSADADFKRVVSVIEHLSAFRRLNPVTTAPTANAIASSSWPGDDPWEAFRFDSPSLSLTDKWSSASGTGTGAWVGWNFGAATEVAGVRFHQHAGYCPTTISIQGSNNGTTWTTVSTITPQNSSTYQSYSFTAATYTYWRLLSNGMSQGTEFIIGGLAFLSPADPITRSAPTADYTVEYTATTTQVTRVASGSEQITVNVLIG